MARYYARINKVTVGPYTLDQIRRHSDIDLNTLVIVEGKTKAQDWVKLRTIGELAALYARQVPPPLPAPSFTPGPKDGTHAPAARPVPPMPHPPSLRAPIPTPDDPHVVASGDGPADGSGRRAGRSVRDLGLLAYRSGDFKTAVGYLNRALEDDSTDAEAMLYRGMAGLQALGVDWWELLSRLRRKPGA